MRAISSVIAAVIRDGSMPPLVSHMTTRSAPASSAVRTTEAVNAGSKRKPSKKCSQSTNTRRPSAVR